MGRLGTAAPGRELIGGSGRCEGRGVVAAPGRPPFFARAAPSMTAMDITIHSTLERLGLVLRTEVLRNG